MMNSFLQNFVKAGIPLGVITGVVFSLIYDWVTGSISGVLSGVSFGLAISFFVAYQAKKFTSNRPLNPNEKLLKEGSANHFLNGEAVGGWIYLTDNRLFFKSHSTNIQKHELSLPIVEIDYAEKGNTFGIIPNQLRLTLRDGQVLKFVVNGANEWVKVIRGLI